MTTIRCEIVQPIPSKFMFSFKLGFDWSGYRIKDFLRKQKNIHVKSMFKIKNKIHYYTIQRKTDLTHLSYYSIWLNNALQ